MRPAVDERGPISSKVKNQIAMRWLLLDRGNSVVVTSHKPHGSEDAENRILALVQVPAQVLSFMVCHPGLKRIKT